MKTFAMLIRREFWEHRMLWMTPLVVTAMMILGVVFIGQPIDVQIGPLPGPRPPVEGNGPGAFGVAQLSLGVPFYIVAALVIIAYLLDCLFAERRDRSILFWKSLPVSDAAVVLSKYFVALVLVPMVFFVVAAATSLAVDGVLVLRSQSGLPMGTAPLWDTAGWLRAQGIILYTMLATVLWYAPYAAYVLLVSAWARRSVLAWAILPPVLLAALEKLLLGTNVLGRMVQSGYSEVVNLAFRVNRQIEVTIGDVIRAPRGGGGGGGRGGPFGFTPRLDPTDLLTSPQLGIGLIVAALLVWGAVALRRRSQDI